MVLFGGWAKTQAGGRALRFVLMAIGFLYDVSIGSYRGRWAVQTRRVPPPSGTAVVKLPR